MVISHKQLKEIDNYSLDNIFADALGEFPSFKVPHADWKFSYTEKLLVPFNHPNSTADSSSLSVPPSASKACLCC